MTDQPDTRAPEQPWKASYFWMRDQRDEARSALQAAEQRAERAEAERDAFKGWRGDEVVERRENLRMWAESEQARAEIAEQRATRAEEALRRVIETDHTHSRWSDGHMGTALDGLEKAQAIARAALSSTPEEESDG